MITDLITWYRAVLDDVERVAIEASRVHDGSAEWRLSVQVGEEEAEWFIDLPDTHICSEVLPDRDARFRPRELRHISLHDPAHVLADVAAKRALLDLHTKIVAVRADYATTDECHSCVPPFGRPEEAWPCLTVRLLASAYAARPGYREEWKP